MSVTALKHISCEIIGDKPVNEPYNALKATHNYVFDSHEPRVTETSKLNLQLLQHRNEYIYGVYRPKQIRVARPTSL